MLGSSCINLVVLQHVTAAKDCRKRLLSRIPWKTWLCMFKGCRGRCFIVLVKTIPFFAYIEENMFLSWISICRSLCFIIDVHFQYLERLSLDFICTSISVKAVPSWYTVVILSKIYLYMKSASQAFTSF